MTEPDPYAVLGVTRAATRDEIARAYRTLAKQHHPDVGAAPSRAMTRLNEAWHVLSEPGRRARWDRAHAVVASPHWSPFPAETTRRPRAVQEAPASPMDSGWMAVGILAVVGILLAVIMIGISSAAQPTDDRLRFTSDELSFSYPSEWFLADTGEGVEAGRPRVVAHLTSFAVDPAQRCTRPGIPCTVTGEPIPAGQASVVITVWETGTPPIPDPVVPRPYGLHADAIIGGKPAAFELRRVSADSIVAWWQLSPPGFPDRWIEVRADIRGRDIEEEQMLSAVESVLKTVEFHE